MTTVALRGTARREVARVDVAEVVALALARSRILRLSRVVVDGFAHLERGSPELLPHLAVGVPVKNEALEVQQHVL